MKVSVIGSGAVGEALANGFLKYGHEVLRASRDPQKLQAWAAAAGAQAGDLRAAAEFGELVVLAVKGLAAEAVLEQCGSALHGKVVIDTTNPIADGPPENGVLRYFSEINDSLMERLQKRFPELRLVKAFSCVGYAYMVDPDFGGERPTMFLCGDDDAAKEVVKEILDRFGWDFEDLGGVEAARAIEPLAILWCIPGFRENRWTHALRLLRQ